MTSLRTERLLHKFYSLETLLEFMCTNEGTNVEVPPWGDVQRCITTLQKDTPCYWYRTRTPLSSTWLRLLRSGDVDFPRCWVLAARHFATLQRGILEKTDFFYALLGACKGDAGPLVREILRLRPERAETPTFASTRYVDFLRLAANFNNDALPNTVAVSRAQSGTPWESAFSVLFSECAAAHSLDNGGKFWCPFTFTDTRTLRWFLRHPACKRFITPQWCQSAVQDALQRGSLQKIRALHESALFWEHFSPAPGYGAEDEFNWLIAEYPTALLEHLPHDEGLLRALQRMAMCGHGKHMPEFTAFWKAVSPCYVAKLQAGALGNLLDVQFRGFPCAVPIVFGEMCRQRVFSPAATPGALRFGEGLANAILNDSKWSQRYESQLEAVFLFFLHQPTATILPLVPLPSAKHALRWHRHAVRAISLPAQDDLFESATLQRKQRETACDVAVAMALVALENEPHWSKNADVCRTFLRVRIYANPNVRTVFWNVFSQSPGATLSMEAYAFLVRWHGTTEHALAIPACAVENTWQVLLGEESVLSRYQGDVYSSVLRETLPRFTQYRECAWYPCPHGDVFFRALTNFTRNNTLPQEGEHRLLAFCEIWREKGWFAELRDEERSALLLQCFREYLRTKNSHGNAYAFAWWATHRAGWTLPGNVAFSIAAECVAKTDQDRAVFSMLYTCAERDAKRRKI